MASWMLKMPVLVRPLKSSILSSTSFKLGKTFWRVVSAAVELSSLKTNRVAKGDGKFGRRGWPLNPSNTQKNTCILKVLKVNILSNPTFPQLFRIFWRIQLCRKSHGIKLTRDEEYYYYEINLENVREHITRNLMTFQKNNLNFHGSSPNSGKKVGFMKKL